VTFGRRLGLFFCLIVLVPMLALILLLVFVSEDSHDGKADARLSASIETALTVYSDRTAEASAQGRTLAADPELVNGLSQNDPGALRAFARQAVASAPVVAVTILDTAGASVAQAGARDAIAFGELAMQSDGKPVGTLRVSTTTPEQFAQEVKRLTSREAVVIRNGDTLGGTVAYPAPDEATGEQRDQLEPGTTADLDLGGQEYRARTQLLEPKTRESVLVLGPREGGGLVPISKLGAGLVLLLLLLATGLAYWLARKLTELHEQVSAEAITDPLTGLYNRRRLQESLSREVDRATRFGHELALLILDVDEFKTINDSRGHLAGDAVLRTVSDCLRQMTRTIDIGVRYGGDELAMIVIETGIEGGERLAERLRAGVAEAEIMADSGGAPVRATVSIGVAAIPDSAMDMDALLNAADQALLQAKLKGKNQIRTAPRGR
jgi:diguanylate cyclase (GGDEF)-like protein